MLFDGSHFFQVFFGWLFVSVSRAYLSYLPIKVVSSSLIFSPAFVASLRLVLTCISAVSRDGCWSLVATATFLGSVCLNTCEIIQNSNALQSLSSLIAFKQKKKFLNLKINVPLWFVGSIFNSETGIIGLGS